jgi:hypothetical protein
MKELWNRLNKELLEKKEKYKDNPEVLKKLKNLEQKIWEAIHWYLEEEKNPNTSEEQKSIILENYRKKIGALENELKIIESDEEKTKRYEWLEKEYDKVKEVEEFKDIIWEKKFDDLTAGDFYAMLRTSPEKVRNLLLSTASWEAVNVNWNWEKYKNKVLKVNFGKNAWLDKIVWAGDILDITKVKSVKINWVEWTRKANPRPWYYAPDGHYLAIHDWYTIEVTQIAELQWEELKQYNASAKKRFDEIRWTEIKASLTSVIQAKIKENPDAREIQIPYKAKVDRNYISELMNKYEYLWVKISEDWKLTLKEWFNVWHLGEAINSYPKTKETIVEYLKNHEELKKQKSLEISASSLGLEKNTEFLENALKTIIWDEKVKIEVDGDNIVIDSSDTDKTIWEIFSAWYEYKWNKHRHEKYKSEISEAAHKFWIPEWAIIQLIYHENASWNPTLKAPGSSAYWLGQMVTNTWARFGSWDRSNPADQLMATARYMKYIQEKKWCSWEEVLAYYNTGLWIRKVWNINKYYNLNPAIARKQPSSEPRTNTNYFIAAIAYYNDLDFATAKTKLKTM